MTDCELFGDCPEPVFVPEEQPFVEEEVVEIDDGNNTRFQSGEEVDISELDPLMGQIAFTMMAFFKFADTGLRHFRYRSADTYYSQGDLDTKVNIWEFANTVADYSNLIVWGPAFVTSCMSFAGFGAINYTVWDYAVFTGLPIFQGIVWFLRFFAYEQEHSNKGVKGKFSDTVFAGVEAESEYAAIFESAMFILFLSQRDNWTLAQYMAMSPEERSIYRGDEIERPIQEGIPDEVIEEMQEGEEQQVVFFAF